jgi:enolase
MHCCCSALNALQQNVNDVLGPALLGKDVTDQQGLDDLMIKLDGTHNKVSI